MVIDDSRMGSTRDSGEKSWDDDLTDLAADDVWPDVSSAASTEGPAPTAASGCQGEATTGRETAAMHATAARDPMAGLRQAAAVAANPPSPTAPEKQQPPAPSDPLAGDPYAGSGVRRSTRDRSPPERLGTLVPHDTGGEGSSPPPIVATTGRTGNNGAATVDHADDVAIAADDQPNETGDGADGTAYAAYTCPNPDKMTLAQARSDPDWMLFDLAVRLQVKALWDDGVLKLAWIPEGADALPLQIICERMRDKRGKVHRRKGRGVACGNYQVEGRNFGEVPAPDVRRATLLTTLAHAAAAGMLMHQLDIETAFLNGPLDQELYVRQPKGYERGDKRPLLRLLRAVYGLRQAARQWILELVKLMDTMGIHQSVADPCLFMKHTDGTRTYLLIYVDDLLLVAQTQDQIEAMMNQVMAAFKSRDLGTPDFFLAPRLDPATPRGGMIVSQRRYVSRLVERHGLTDAKPTLLPMTPGARPHEVGVRLD